MTTSVLAQHKRTIITQYTEGKPIITDNELTALIPSLLGVDGFGFSVDNSSFQLETEVRRSQDYEDGCPSHRSVNGLSWDKRYTIGKIPGFIGSIVVFARMRHVPCSHFDKKMTTREEFQTWCKDQRNLDRRRKRWNQNHPPEPGKSQVLPKELFGLNLSKTRTGVLVDSLEDTQLTTAEIMGIVVCYDGLYVGRYREELVLRKIVSAIEKRYHVRIDSRQELSLYGGIFAKDAHIFCDSTIDAKDVSKTIQNVFKAGTALEASIKKYENQIARPIIDQFD